ncbi:MAG: hypothetical protein DMG97_28680, partial [Acidobacteria bacterium]
PTCATSLQRTSQPKYDSFWVVLLIFAGAVFAFYLMGIAVMAIGLTLVRKQQSRWICPNCYSNAQPAPA